jgi:transcriptional regulator with XRE-family HTH domain
MNGLDRKAFSNRLAALRAERDMTQEQLADASGVALNSIARYESQANGPSLDVACKLATALGCSIDVLAGRVSITG